MRSDLNDVLDVVIDRLSTQGYDGWLVKEVAQEARVSTGTIYKHIPSRDALIVAAVQRWMTEHAYRQLDVNVGGSTPLEFLSSLMHALFDPWVANPWMLEAFVRVSAAGAGRSLRLQGQAELADLWPEGLRTLDQSTLDDLDLIITNVTVGAMFRHVNGEIPVTGIVPIVDRALARVLEPPGQKRGAARWSRRRAAEQGERAS